MFRNLSFFASAFSFVFAPHNVKRPREIAKEVACNLSIIIHTPTQPIYIMRTSSLFVLALVALSACVAFALKSEVKYSFPVTSTSKFLIILLLLFVALSTYGHLELQSFEERNVQSAPGDDDYFPQPIVEALIVMVPFLFILSIGIYCTCGVQSELKFDAERPKRF